MPDITYIFKTDVPAAKSDVWFRYVAKQRPFVADPSFSRQFIFAFDGDTLLGCLGMYKTQLATFWVGRQDVDVGTGMAIRLSQRLFQDFKQLSHLTILIHEIDLWIQGQFESAGFKFTGEIRPSPSGNYKVYTVARFEEAIGASEFHNSGGRKSEEVGARNVRNPEGPHSDKGKAPH